MARAPVVGVADQLLVEEGGVENVYAHAGKRPVGRARHRPRLGRLLFEAADAPGLLDTHHAEAARFGERHLHAHHGRVGVAGGMRLEQPAVVHLVDVIAREHQHVLAAVAAQHVEVLEHGIGRAAVPALGDLLLRRQDIDMLADAPVEEGPAALQVANQTVGLVLRGDADAAHARVDAVGEREVDDAVLAAEGHRGLATPVGELLQPAAASPGEHQCVSIAREPAEDAAADFALPRLGNLLAGGHRSPKVCAEPIVLRKASGLAPTPARSPADPGRGPARCGRASRAAAAVPAGR